ncbi:MAG: type II secretion system F family protein [Bacilli bacterium]
MAKKKELARKIYSDSSIKKIETRINLLGEDAKFDAITFMNVRLLMALGIFFLTMYLFKWGYIYAPLFTFLFYVYLPKLTYEKDIIKRCEILDNDAMYFFEVLTLSLESGRSLKTAIEITANNIDSKLSNEFKKALDEVRLGKSLNEALDSLKQRIPSDTINNIILNIKESNIFGNSIITTMYNQIDYITEKKISEVKSKINMIPIKVSVLSVIFFIPLLMLLILSPIIINYFS